jgi:predicted transcriptional regulator
MYMLSRVNFPLNNSQISEFMSNEYTNYFTLQELLNDLSANNFISAVTYGNTTQYHLTAEVADTISYFSSRISSEIKSEIEQYLTKNKYELKNEAGTIADYYPSTNHEYIVHCQVKEGESTLIELSLSVPTEEQASTMCSNWKNASSEIYEFVMHRLM